MTRTTTLTLLALVLAGAPARGQALGDRIRAAHGARVTFQFAARPGVCGNGENLDTHHAEGDLTWDCHPGPLVVTLTRDDAGRVTRLRTSVGAPPPADATDLGAVTPAEASAWLLDLAGADLGKPSEAAVLPAVLARDVESWPRLARLAKDTRLQTGLRRQAVFWLGQEAADAVVGPLDTLLTADPDRDVRRMALFTLSQRHDERSFQILLRIARGDRDPDLRRQAFFWLGRSEDPRGVAFFEEMLAGR